MKKLLFTLTFILMALTANAQAYDITCDKSNDNTYTCSSRLFEVDGKKMRLHLSSMDFLSVLHDNPDLTNASPRDVCFTMVSFEIWQKNLAKDNISIQIKLSNGDILSCNEDIMVEEILLGERFSLASYLIKVNNVNKDKNGIYIISLLRTYNIVSLTIGGTTINTPNMRSADTFDAMCKTLVSKTGDQGQYGKRLTNNNNNNASNAQKPQTPTTSKPSTNSTQQNSQKPNSSNSSSKPSTSNSQSSTNNVDLSRASAKTLKAEAEKYNPDAMYLLGCRYHDGQLAGIEKNDRLSYQWLMTYYHVSNEKDGEKALDYIKNNLKRNNSTLKPSFEYLTKETNLTPMDFILHPLAYFPTSAIFMKEANMEREITTKKQLTIYTSYKKKFDKGKIEIWGKENPGKMPKLFNKEAGRMEWRSKNKKYADYNFYFRFGNRNEAETFLYTIAYETMQEGVFWEKSGFKTPRKIDEDISLGYYSTYLTINGKRYSVIIKLFLFDGKNAKPEERYTIDILVSLVQS